jgi:hypothetical protein
MLRRTILGVFVASMLMTTGCSTLLKQGYYAAVGAGGSFYELKVVDPQKLAEYKSVTVKPFSNSLGPCVPAEVMAEVHRSAPQRLAESHLFYPTGKKLRVEGTVIHYTGKNGIVGAASALLGSEACVCRVQLYDDASNTMIGEGVCWGTVKSMVRRGAEEFGVGVGKGLCAWFKKRLPEAELKKREEDLKPKDK